MSGGGFLLVSNFSMPLIGGFYFSLGSSHPLNPLKSQLKKGKQSHRVKRSFSPPKGRDILQKGRRGGNSQASGGIKKVLRYLSQQVLVNEKGG